ncbi:MAG TPA: hypothetical protein VJ124_17970 [Pyrinomonadaceae bacterium]|nr:hypothetical protein [Pyrinomonadaceae bacterium]
MSELFPLMLGWGILLFPSTFFLSRVIKRRQQEIITLRAEKAAIIAAIVLAFVLPPLFAHWPRQAEILSEFYEPAPEGVRIVNPNPFKRSKEGAIVFWLFFVGLGVWLLGKAIWKLALELKRGLSAKDLDDTWRSFLAAHVFAFGLTLSLRTITRTGLVLGAGIELQKSFLRAVGSLMFLGWSIFVFGLLLVALAGFVAPHDGRIPKPWGSFALHGLPVAAAWLFVLWAFMT